jgi:hypothetical protein
MKKVQQATLTVCVTFLTQLFCTLLGDCGVMWLLRIFCLSPGKLPHFQRFAHSYQVLGVHQSGQVARKLLGKILQKKSRLAHCASNGIAKAQDLLLLWALCGIANFCQWDASQQANEPGFHVCFSKFHNPLEGFRCHHGTHLG